MSQIPSIGRIVHYKLPVAYGPDSWRPAIITQVFEGGYASGYGSNLTVFLDGANDMRYPEHVQALSDQGCVVDNQSAGCGSVTSAEEGTEPGSWRWPPRV